MPEASFASPRRQRSAILFADVHGYTRLMARNEERTYERVTQAVRLIRSLIGDYGGHVQHVVWASGYWRANTAQPRSRRADRPKHWLVKA